MRRRFLSVLLENYLLARFPILTHFFPPVSRYVSLISITEYPPRLNPSPSFPEAVTIYLPTMCTARVPNSTTASIQIATFSLGYGNMGILLLGQ